MYDTVIVGGGPAGLQAALTLGRVHRPTVLFDEGGYRNDPTAHVHNVLGFDGTPPAELRARARAELAAYETVEVRDEPVTTITREDEGFLVTTGDGTTVHARTVILATGITDALPDIPGLAAQWGHKVAHCPFCHGHEFAGRPVAVIAENPHAAVQAAKLRRVASEVHVVAPSAVERVHETSDGLTLDLTDGSTLEVAGVFVHPRSSQRAPFAEQLGLTVNAFGLVAVDGVGQTSVDGVSAVGDMAQSEAWPAPLSSVVLAMSTGQLAAFGMVQRFAMEELAHAAP